MVVGVDDKGWFCLVKLYLDDRVIFVSVCGALSGFRVELFLYLGILVDILVTTSGISTAVPSFSSGHVMTYIIA